MKHGPVVHNVAEYYGLGHSVSFFQINNFRRMSACSVGQNWLGWSWARGEARIEMILVHCPLDRIKLYNLYGKNWIDYYRFDFHHDARAPGKVNVASPLSWANEPAPAHSASPASWLQTSIQAHFADTPKYFCKEMKQF